MSGSILDVVVVGGGYSGLCASYYLKHFGLDHIVFERGKIGQSWESQRWDSFTMTTSNRLNAMPGSHYSVGNPEGFSLADEFITSLKLYAAKHQLPVSENSDVVRIEKEDPSPYFNVTVLHENEERKYFCWRILVASGTFSEMKMPSFANLVLPHVEQLHASAYRNPSQLQSGAVLVVGSGQSGCQITEELMEYERKVYLSTSPVPRIPRRYRGKDIMDWLIESKYFDIKVAEAADAATISGKEPILSGVGEGGHTISLQALARNGAVLLGSMEGADGSSTFFSDNLSDHIRFADEFSNKAKSFIERYIAQKRIVAPIHEEDNADFAGLTLPFDTPIKSLDLEKHNVNTIIWATGFREKLDYIKFPTLDAEGRPRHQNGIGAVEGFYFLGFPWLRTRKSSYLFGIKDDAGFICNEIYTTIR
ncbi:MAG: NAD(P)/FAD-dependent oxidoreductase [Cyclobacteriaceae bacterium]|nr:NAD(P)/FAD-dependent oxidoreductase [Cyclobacteriaceae bacterium]